MSRWLWLALFPVLLALAIVGLAHGQPIGECKAAQLQQDGRVVGCIDDVFNLSAADFSCFSAATGVTCSVINRFGTCIGEPADWCGTVDLTGVTVVLPNISGNVAVAGNLTTTGDVTATGNVFANTLRGTNGVYSFTATLGWLEFQSGSSTNNPAWSIFHKTGTITGATTLNLDFSLTAGTPFLAPCPASQTCIVTAWIQCHCSGGSACTANQSAAHGSRWVFKNNGGTITQIGSQTSGNLLATALDAAGSNVASITASLSAPNFRFAIVGTANYNNNCAGTFLIASMG